MPKAGFEIRPVEPFRAKSAAGGEYQGPSEDGSRPGIFYVNTFDLPSRKTWDAEDLFLHEAIPAITSRSRCSRNSRTCPHSAASAATPPMSKAGRCTPNRWARTWACTHDPYDYFGRLQDELWRAIRLVTDTGLHSKGWTREQVIKYMLDNSARVRNRCDRRGRTLHRHARPGAGLQDRRAEDPGSCKKRAKAALGDEVRRPRIPCRSAEGWLGAAGCAGGEGRSLDSEQEDLMPVFNQ